MEINKSILISDLHNLGVRSGDLLNVKVSLKSIGIITGGAQTLIDALLDVVGPEGTIITDSFVQSYPLPLSTENAKLISGPDTPSYAGAVANAMIHHPKAFRSPHPIQKFVGIGKLAKELTQSHDVGSPAYGLLGDISLLGGKNVKIGDIHKVPGVGTTHVAIERLGIRRIYPPQGVNYIDRSGNICLFKMHWAGGCPDAWLKFYPYYENIGAVVSNGFVGKAPSMITDMKKTLDWEISYIGNNPKVLCCDRLTCITCRLEWDFAGRSLPMKIFISGLRNGWYCARDFYRLLKHHILLKK